MQRLLVAVTLKQGASAKASELIAAGPPFDLAAAGLARHGVYLSEHEVVFAFEGRSVERLVSRIVNEPAHAGAFAHWAPLTEGSPRLVLERYHWSAEGEAESKEATMKTLLIATDGSPAAEAVVDAGLALAADTGARAVFVHVTDPIELPFGRFEATPVPARPLPEASAVPALAAAAARAGEQGVECTTKLVAGLPVPAILAVAAEVDAELIVVGSRGHGPLARAFLGSVSTELAQTSRRPVLVVHETRKRVEERAAG